MDRPKWMPSEEEMRREFYENIHRESAAAHCDRVSYRTGLRAQIAALEEMLGGVCMSCNYYNKIKTKIAALRKELEG